MTAWIFRRDPACTEPSGLPSPDSSILLRHPIVKRPLGGAGMLTCYPSATPFGLALGPASASADLPSAGNRRLSATRVLIVFIATYAGRVSSVALSSPRGLPSDSTECSPTKTI